MNEKEKTVHADEFEGNRTNSSNEQTYYTGNSNDFQNLALRALVKIVESLESLHGEFHLMREAEEKQAVHLKRLADIVERADGHILECNEFLDQISRDINGTYSATSVCRAETIRISNGLQAALPHYLDGAKESYKDLELYKDKFTV